MTDTQPPTLTPLFPTQEDRPEEPGLLRPDTIFLQTSDLALKLQLRSTFISASLQNNQPLSSGSVGILFFTLNLFQHYYSF